MKSINELLETVAILVWIAAGVYAFISIRRMTKRLDAVIASLEEDTKPEVWR